MSRERRRIMYYSIYFSPTGGTKKVADILAKNLDGEYLPIDLCNDIEALTLRADDLCLISVPSYGGRVPTTNLERLKKINGNGAKAILNCVYGNRHWDDTLTELQDVLEALGFVCVSALATVAEHSMFPGFAVGRPDAADEAQLKDFAHKIQEKLRHNVFEKLELAGSHGTYKEFPGTPVKPTGDDQCISCGLCAQNCPANAIDRHNPRVTDQSKCITCMRCVRLCPVQARQLDATFVSAMVEKLGSALGGHKENHLFL